MKRHEEEKLISLAFGELCEEEAVNEEQSFAGDPRVGSRLAEYRRLREDLSLLNDIPEPQISKERIREAILRQGLKDRRSRIGWSLALVPAVVAMAATVFVLNQPVPQSRSIGAVAVQKTPELPDMARLVAPAATPVFSTPTELTDLGRAAGRDYSFGSEQALPSRHSSRRYRSYFKPSTLEFVPKDAVALTPPAQSHSSTDSSGFDGAGQADTSGGQQGGALQTLPPANGDDGKIIVVHDAQDQSTGTEQATEVDRTANVLVGG